MPSQFLRGFLGWDDSGDDTLAVGRVDRAVAAVSKPFTTSCAGGLTIWAVAGYRAPAALRHLDEADLNLDLPDRVITLICVNLALQRLQGELLLSMAVEHLRRHISRIGAYACQNSRGCLHCVAGI